MKTLDIVRASEMNQDDIVAAREMVSIHFRDGASYLSLPAAKLFWLLLKVAGSKVAEDVWHRVPYAQINETFHLSKPQLEDAISELKLTQVSIELVRDDRPYRSEGPILAGVEREEEWLRNAEIRFKFSEALRLIIERSEFWAHISRRCVLSFDSRFSLSLYAYLSARKNLRNVSEEVTIEELRHILGIEGKYRRWPDIRRFVLDVAKSEINQLADFVFSYEPTRWKGRKVSHVKLVWGKKDIPGIAAAQAAQEMTRVQRRAYRLGVEKMVDEDRDLLAEAIYAAGTQLPYAPKSGTEDGTDD